MRWHWSGVIRLIATIVGLGVGILDKFVLGSGWTPAIGLTILVFLAIPFITGLVWEAVEPAARTASLRRDRDCALMRPHRRVARPWLSPPR